jgi:hypothetical protein
MTFSTPSPHSFASSNYDSELFAFVHLSQKTFLNDQFLLFLVAFLRNLLSSRKQHGEDMKLEILALSSLG